MPPPERSLLEPWQSFLAELDGLLTAPAELICVGGFALSACYGLARPTADVDYIAAEPSESIPQLQQLAGPASALARKHKVYLQHVTVIGALPENHRQRLREIPVGGLMKLRLFALDPCDLLLSKLERNSPKDREDVAYLASAIPIEFIELEQRYRTELRPYLSNETRHDLTLQLWRDAYFDSRRG